MNNYTKGSLSLFTARVLSGLNVNAMGYLLPLWISPLSSVVLRLAFGAVVFWIVGIFAKPESVALKDKLKLFMLGGGGPKAIKKEAPTGASFFTSYTQFAPPRGR